MHLADLIALRVRPAAVALLAVTQRCPLRCAHCATGSTMDSPDGAESALRALVASFTPGEHPAAVVLSGGEPLLRPELVADLAVTGRRAGTRSAVVSGMFFANRSAIPRAIRRAAGAVDHFSASLDAYHEREVDRSAVFAALGRILDWVPQASLHVCGAGDDDPYVAGLVADLRRRFGHRVPALVVPVRPIRRSARRTRPTRASSPPPRWWTTTAPSTPAAARAWSARTARRTSCWDMPPATRGPCCGPAAPVTRCCVRCGPWAPWPPPAGAARRSPAECVTPACGCRRRQPPRHHRRWSRRRRCYWPTGGPATWRGDGAPVGQ
ncbi:MAG TPA: radical SAM protein [Pilimelia sp.]|nr:radical SAM protein [Pilimelia sp.]